MVNMSGTSANRVKRPNMRSTEQNTSAKMAILNDTGLLSP